MRYLLDTSVISSPIAKKPSKMIVDRLSERSHECAIAAPVWHELTYGCRRLPPGKRRAALESYLEEVVHASFPILSYDEAAASWHAHERARLDGLGRPTPFLDAQIAAIACVNDLVLVTVNTKDFNRFKGLSVENWASRRAGDA